MIKHYQHTQIGYAIIIIYSIPILFIIYLMTIGNFNWIIFVALAILGIFLPQFGKLTITIDQNFIELFFGLGIIQKKFSLNAIKSCHVVKNHWYYGLGIRLTPHGWLYAISGLDAVEIEMNTGKKYRIGTDDPEELEQAILKAIEATD